jgi:acetylornithine deacetylase
VQISTAGKRMHASLAGKKQNAIEAMLDVMRRISRYMVARRPELIYNIRDLFSAPGGFVVPERCEAWIDVHLPPDAPIGQIVTELEEAAVQGGGDPAGSKIAHRNVTIDAGYALPEKGMLVDVIKTVFSKRNLPWNPQPFRSHSDANQLWAAGIKPVVLGPGKLEMAHVPDESVSFSQVCLAAELYLEIMLNLAGK